MSRPIAEIVGSLMPELKADLARLVAIPSISAANYPEPTHPALLEAYEEVVRLCRDAGVRILDPLELPNTATAVTGEIPAPDGAPTVLLYGHYDVVPVGDEAKWASPPFGATERAGAIYGRGAADSKSNILMHIGALRAWEGKPPVGIKIVIEGMEEVGSAFGAFPPSRPDLAAMSESPYVSTGHLPAAEVVRGLVEDAYERYRRVADGAISDVYPALARVPSDLFGVCVVGTNGDVFGVGDYEREFSMMSVSKPFVFALVCESLGAEEARGKLGVNSTGLPFNSLEAIEQSPEGRTNPMVNPGAIAATSLVDGATEEAKWQVIHDGLSRFAGRPLSLNAEVYESASETNHQNRSIARVLESYGRIYSDPAEAIDLYTRQCSLNVTAGDLAVMGATLADGGVNPVTGGRVIEATTASHTLAVMTTAGLYETSGDWLYDIGLPGKSGIGGGIVTVAPGKGALGTFAPPLDGAGNSVRGQLVAAFLARRLGLDLFISEAEA